MAEIRWRKHWVWPALAGALVGIALRLVYSGGPNQPYSPMMGVFIGFAPAAVAAIAVYLAECSARRTWWQYAQIGAMANVFCVLGALAILVEGLICAVVIVPLFAGYGAVAGLLMGAVCRLTNWPKHAMYSVVALPMLLGGVEHGLPLPNDISVVIRTRLIDATPEAIWAQLMTPGPIRAEEIEDAWMYRIGVPVPESAVSEVGPERIIRHIRMGKGIRFDQVAVEWELNRSVRWRYRFAPDSFPSGALDDHVRIGGDYFDILDTTYALEPTPDGTLLHASMTYRVSTRFNWYAEPIAALLVGNFEEAALRFYATRAERPPPRG